MARTIKLAQKYSDWTKSQLIEWLEKLQHQVDEREALWDENGTAVRMAGSFRDVFDRNQSEEALRESEERFALAAAGTNDGIWDFDFKSG